MTTAGQGRMAAVLFTDLVGSTELLSRLGEAAFDGLRRAHFAALREAIGRTGGAEVNGTGDGLLATFASAADAVGCAVGMQQAVDVHARSEGVPLAIRVGVSVGDVVFEDGDVFGTPVVEAARLVAVARGGQILTTALVRGMAGGRSVAGFTDIGCLDLKGLPAPVATCEVAWEPLPAPALPMPTVLSRSGRIFVGREAELEHLDGCWRQVTAGTRHGALVAGEPGVGKTRLASELAALVHAEGATVLAGRCDEDLGVPYQPFVEALRHFIDHTPGEVLSPQLGRYGGELARLIPELSQALPDLPPPLRSDPETERYRLFDAVAAWMAAISASSPALLVLDDLQWAAKPTLLLLRHVLRSSERMSLLVLATYRDTEVGRTHPLSELLADLRQLESVERVSLRGLDQPAVAAFLEHAAGHELAQEKDELASVIHRETEGNAFFVREVVRHLIETGGFVQQDGRWGTSRPVTEMGIPDGVRDVVGRRLSRLSSAANQSLGVAAVAGEEFELAVVERAGGMDEEALLTALDEAVAARLVVEVSGPAPGYRFAHAVVRSTLYDEVSGARRVILHRRVAEAIESLHAGRLDHYLPALAHHYAKAAAPRADTAKAVEYAARAGRRALAQLAHDEAASYYRQALELLDTAGADPADPRRVELLVGRGEAQRRAGDPEFRQTLLDAAHLARELGDTPALARAALANNRGHIYSSGLVVDAARVDTLEAAITAVGDSDPATRARLLATLGMELAWQPDPRRRLTLSQEALMLASSLDEPATLAHVLLARDYTITAPDNTAERFAATTQMLALADRLGDPVATSRALILRFKAAVELADLAEAERCHTRHESLVADLGQPFLTWAAMHHRAGLAVLRADDGAERAIAAAHEFGTAAGQVDVAFFSFAQKWPLYFDQGRTEELREFVVAVGERFPENPLPKLFQAIILSEAGEADRGGVFLDELAATGFAHPTNNVNWLHFSAHCAWLCARLHRPEHVPLLRSRLEPYADQLVAIALGGAINGSVASYVALLCTTVADWPAAEAYFRAAEAIDERIGAPTWLVRTRVERARMLKARAGPGDSERADHILHQALATARELRLVNIERGAVELLGQVS